MPVKIPQYEATNVAQGFLNIGGFPQANPPDTPGYIGAGMQKLGDAITSYAAFQKKDEVDNAIVQKGKWLSEGQVYWDKQLIDGFNGTADGKVKDAEGNTANLSDDLNARFQKWRTEALAAESDPRVRRWMEGQINNLQTHVMQRGLVLQNRATQSDKEKGLETTIHNYETQLRTGQIGLEYARTQIMPVIANSGLDPVTRNKFAQEVEGRLASAFGTGQAYQNPRGFRGAIEGYFGSQDSTRTYLDQTDKVFQRESGDRPITNTMSGASGRGQWMPDTWAAVRKQFPDFPADPNQATKDQERQANAWFAGNNQRAMTAQLGRPASPGELGLAHFVGASGAVALLRQDPNVKLADLPDNFWKNLGEKFSNQTFLRQNPSYAGMTVGQVVQKYRNQFEGGAPGAPVAPGAPGAAAAAPAGQPINPDMALMFRMMDTAKLTQFAGFAQGIENKEQARARVDLEGVITNHNAMFMNGQTVGNPLNFNDFDRAFGPVEGSQRWRAYQNNMQLGSDIQNLQSATPEQATGMMTAAKPNPASPDYATQVNRYNTMTEAWNRITTARNQDPIEFARQTSNATVPPIDYSDAGKFAESVRGRIPIAETNRTMFGVGGVSGNLVLFSNTEKAQAQAMFQKASDQERVGYINTLAKATQDNPEAFRSVIQQLFPDRPVYRMAGDISLNQRMIQESRFFGADPQITGLNVAEIMIRGETLLHPNKATREENGTGKTIIMPKDNDFDRAVNDRVRDAFRGRTDVMAEAIQGVKAFYAGWTDRNGTFSDQVDNKTMDLAIRAVVGHIDTVGAGKAQIAPWGMEGGAFRNAIETDFNRAMRDHGFAGTPQGNLRLYNVENYGGPGAKPNQYVLNAGTNYLKDRAGNTIILDLNETPNRYPAEPAQPTAARVTGRSDAMNAAVQSMTAQERNLIRYHDTFFDNRNLPKGPDGNPTTVGMTAVTIPEGRPYAGRVVVVPNQVGGQLIGDPNNPDDVNRIYEYWSGDVSRGPGGRVGGRTIAPSQFPMYATMDAAQRAIGQMQDVINDDFTRRAAADAAAARPPQPGALFPATAPMPPGSRGRTMPSGKGAQQR